MPTLKGATFNLKFGRDDKVVQGEVNRLVDKHNLDFLVVQEAAEYRKVLDNIPGYEYFTNRNAGTAGLQVGILVKDTRKIDRVKTRNLGDGWTTITGARHGALTVPKVRIDKWLTVAGLHAPTPTEWVGGKLRGPADRVDDYKALATFLLVYFRPPALRKARIAVGDWNENPTTQGTLAPRWIAVKTGAKIVAAKSRQGHGIIDYPMFKGCKITNIFKDTDIKEGSDHEPVIFTVTK